MEKMKDFNDLSDTERKELETILKNKAEKNGRSLLQDVKCVFVEDKESKK